MQLITPHCFVIWVVLFLFQIITCDLFGVKHQPLLRCDVKNNSEENTYIHSYSYCTRAHTENTCTFKTKYIVTNRKYSCTNTQTHTTLLTTVILYTHTGRVHTHAQSNIQGQNSSYIQTYRTHTRMQTRTRPHTQHWHRHTPSRILRQGIAMSLSYYRVNFYLSLLPLLHCASLCLSSSNILSSLTLLSSQKQMSRMKSLKKALLQDLLHTYITFNSAWLHTSIQHLILHTKLHWGLSSAELWIGWSPTSRQWAVWSLKLKSANLCTER